MPILSKFRTVTDKFTHRHKHKISVDDNPLCADRVTDRLHSVGLRHSYCINQIDAYLTQIKEDRKTKIKSRAETRGSIPASEKLLKQIINAQREKDSKALSDFVIQAHKAKKLNQKTLDTKIKALEKEAIAAVRKAMKDPMSEIEYTGGAAPNRTKIIKHITEAKQKYLEAVENKKLVLEKHLFKTKGNSYEQSSEALRKTEQEVDSLKKGVIGLCGKLDEIVSIYQASISNEAMKRQDKQAKLELGQKTFKGLGDAFGRISYFGDIPAAISDSIGSVFDVLIAYQSMKEPVKAQQEGAKFLVEVVFDQTKEFVRNVEKHFSAFQRSLAMWNDQMKQSYQIGHDEEILNLKKKKYGEASKPAPKKGKDQGTQTSNSNPLNLNPKQLRILQKNKLEGVYIPEDGKCLFNAIGHQLGQTGDNIQKAVLAALTNFDRKKAAPTLVSFLSEGRKIMKMKKSEDFIAKIQPAIQSYNWTKDIYDFVPKLIATVMKVNLTIIKTDGKAEQYNEGSKRAIVVHTGNHYHSTKRSA
ncbi:MAG: hypothetical protein AB8E82_05975 [Aureispira sp.]